MAEQDNSLNKLDTEIVHGTSGAEIALTQNGETVKERSRTYDTPVTLPKGPHATVGVRREFTKNLGNYQSIKGGVWVELPCEPTPEGLEKAYSEAGLFVANNSAVELQDAEEWAKEVELV